MGLYYAWHGITRFNDGVATVNMFLNRGSSWLDVDSWLPYEGKVLLTNKQGPQTVMVPCSGLAELLPEIQVSSTTNASSRRGPALPGLRGDFTRRDHRARPGGRFVWNSPSSYDTKQVHHVRPDLHGQFSRGHGGRHPTPQNAAGFRRVHGRAEDVSDLPANEMKATRAPMGTVRRFIPDRVLPLQ